MVLDGMAPGLGFSAETETYAGAKNARLEHASDFRKMVYRLFVFSVTRKFNLIQNLQSCAGG